MSLSLVLYTKRKNRKDNKDSLREAIEKVLFDEELSQIFAENGNKLIKEKYNWDIINDQILEIYNKYLIF